MYNLAGSVSLFSFGQPVWKVGSFMTSSTSRQRCLHYQVTESQHTALPLLGRLHSMLAHADLLHIAIEM